MVFITAGGAVIDTIYDAKAKHIYNKTKEPQVKTNSKNWISFYLLLTYIGISLGAVVSYSIKKPLYSILFIIIALCFYAYARVVKKWFLINNILLALLSAFTVVILIFFDLYPHTFSFAQLIELKSVQTIGYIAIAVFYLNFVSEVVKDFENINADYMNDRKTYAIVLGRERATMFVFWLTAIGFVASVLLSITLFRPHTLLLVYTLLCVSIPLLWICKIAWDASQPKDYKKISVLLKLTLVLGLGIVILLPSFYNS